MFRSQNNLGGKALTLGVLTNWVADPYQAGILRGVSQAANAAGANLLVFVGGNVPAKPGQVDGSDFIYDYARKGVVDGVLLLSSTLMHEVGQAGLETFAQRFGELPVVSAGAALSSIPSVTVNNAIGVEGVIDHLVDAHGAKNFACIHGPKANAEVTARTGAYLAALSRHGLPVVERWMVEGNFTKESGRNAIAALAKLPGFQFSDLDAIVVNNDSMAIGAMNELAARGIAVPEQIAVVGFDDLLDAELVQPPLTSIAQPLAKIGIQATRSLAAYVQHGVAPENEVLDTEVKLRRSCGCADFFAPPRSSFVPPPGRGADVTTMLRRERVLLEMTRSSQGGLGSAGRGWEQALFGAFTQTIAAPFVAGGQFMREFQLLAERVAQSGGDLKLLDQVMEVFRQQMIPVLRSDEQRRERADDLFHMARGTLSKMQQRRLSRTQLSLDRWNHTLALVCNELSGAYGRGRLRAVLARHIGTLGIQSCFVAAYIPGTDYQEAVLLAAFDAEVDCSAFENRPFRASEVIPPELAHLGKRPHSYVVQPLVWDGQRLGHMLVEMDTETLFLSGAICGAVAIALRGTY